MENEKIQEILKDKEFSSQVLKMETPEEVQKAFKQKGIELSLNEIGIVGDLVNRMIAKNSTYLSEEDLKEIAGGVTAKIDGLNTEQQLDEVVSEGYKEVIDRYVQLTPNQIKAIECTSVAAGFGILGLSAIGLGTVAVGGFKAVKWAGKKILGRR